MEILNILLLFGVGLLAGAINTLAGGGSLLSLPVLITVIGLPPNVANATNRVAILFQNFFAMRGFKSKGVSAYPYSLWLGISAFFGAILGAQLAVDIKGETFNKILAGVILMVVFMMLFGPKHGEKKENTDRKATITGVITFFFIGIYGGFIQAGVGYLIMASLTFINGFSLVKTNSAKVLIVLIYTLASLGIFIYNGLVNWEFGLALAVGNSTGGWLASRWSVGKGDKWIRYFVMITALAFAVKLFFFPS